MLCTGRFTKNLNRQSYYQHSLLHCSPFSLQSVLPSYCQSTVLLQEQLSTKFPEEHLIFFQEKLSRVWMNSPFGTIPVPNNFLHKSPHYEFWVRGVFSVYVADQSFLTQNWCFPYSLCPKAHSNAVQANDYKRKKIQKKITFKIWFRIGSSVTSPLAAISLTYLFKSLFSASLHNLCYKIQINIHYSQI